MRSRSYSLLALAVGCSLWLSGVASPVQSAVVGVPSRRPLTQQETQQIYALQGTLQKARNQNFDTFMVTTDNKVYALVGETPDIELQLSQLRDSAPNTVAKVWGVLYPQGRVSATPEIVVSNVLGVGEGAAPQPQPTQPPQPTPQPSGPQLVVTVASLNVRSGPDTAYPALNALNQGQRCDINGKNQAITWWQVACQNGVIGWVFGSLVETTGDTSGVPVVNVPPPPAPPTPAPPATFYGWRTAFFGNRDLSGGPVAVIDAPDVNFDWGVNAPYPGVPADNFSTRFERTINFNPGTYRFTARSDDGVRVWIDNQPIIDQWHSASGNVDYIADRSMYGNQSVRVEHYDEGGNALIRFSFAPLSNTTIDGGGSGEWEATYFNNPDLSGNPILVRREPRAPYPLDSDWGNGSPAPGVVNNDNWSARWRGSFYFDDGDFVFQVRADDGVRVYIDGIRIVDAWYDGYKEPSNRFRQLGRGNHEITIEFYERGGSAFDRVWWYRESGGSVTGAGGGGGNSGGGLPRDD